MKTIVLGIGVAAMCLWLAVSARLGKGSGAAVSVADGGGDTRARPAPASTESASAHSATPQLQPMPRIEAKLVPEPIAPAELRAQQRRLLDDELAGQGTDAEWSSWAEREIYETLGANDAITGLSVACRETLCKLEATLATSDRIAEDVQTVLRQIPWDMGAFFEVSRDQKTLSMYVSREDSPLPMVEM